LLTLGAALGCGAPAANAEDSEQLATRSSDLEVLGGGEAFEYVAFSFPQPPNGVVDPTMCTLQPPSGGHSKLIFSQDSSNFIQGAADDVGAWSSYAKYGGGPSLRTLNGRPACGFLTTSTSPYPFLIVARGKSAPDGTTDKRLYWSKGAWTVDATFPPPAAVTQWAKIDDSQYSVNGTPAIAAHGNELILVYFDDSGRLKGNYWDNAHGTFSATITGPALPSGWAGAGTPAIAYVGSTAQKFIIWIRAKNGAQDRLYETAFLHTGFASGSPVSVSLQTDAAMDGDPAYEYDATGNNGWGWASRVTRV
jgi:hypothetical protein